MRIHGVWWLATLLLLVGCGGSKSTTQGDGAAPQDEAEPPEQPAEGQDDELKTLVQAAKRIRANPEQTEAILAEFGWTVQQYREHMVEVASDPQTSERFVSLLGG